MIRVSPHTLALLARAGDSQAVMIIRRINAGGAGPVYSSGAQLMVVLRDRVAR